MIPADLREEIATLEAMGEMKRIKAEVNWNLELAGITKGVLAKRGPALLFENIKDYHNTPGRKLFTNGMGNRVRLATVLGLPKETPFNEIVETVRKRLKAPMKPKTVATGPCKENIVKGSKINLFDFPVPKWHALDGGRYINTFGGFVSRDPETREVNVGMYRAMIVDQNRMTAIVNPVRQWGTHYSKYKDRNEAMPAALVIGGNDLFPFVASAPMAECEYDAMGGLMEEPVKLVKCETSDLEVPASAEIVIEGSISTDPKTYEMEGPFGEWSGYYCGAKKRPVMKVDCITYRNDPIFRGQVEGSGPGIISESGYMYFAVLGALMWNTLEDAGIPGILDIVPTPVTIVKIHKTYHGQAKQIALALWGARLSIGFTKIVMVVEEEVDIRNPREFQMALLQKVDPAKSLFVLSGYPGDVIDPSMPVEDKYELEGTVQENKLLIDATTRWDEFPIREEWDNKRFPPTCTKVLPEIEELVKRRWKEYGL